MKPLLYTLGVLALLVIGFFAFNSYIYNAKQAEAPIVEEDMPTGEIVGENMEGEADSSVMKLGMKEWVWQYTTKSTGEKVTPKVPGAFGIAFSVNDTRFVVGTDCNRMGGTYTTSGNEMKLTDIFSTKMYCEGSQEGEFAGFLGEVTTYAFTSRGELILYMKDNQGTITLR